MSNHDQSGIQQPISFMSPPQLTTTAPLPSNLQSTSPSPSHSHSSPSTMDQSNSSHKKLLRKPTNLTGHARQAKPKSTFEQLFPEQQTGAINRENQRIITGPVSIHFAQTDFDVIPQSILGKTCHDVSIFCFGNKPSMQTIAHFACLWVIFLTLIIFVWFMSMNVYTPGRFAYRQLTQNKHDYVTFQDAYKYNEFLTHYWLEDFSIKSIPPLLQDKYINIENPTTYQPIEAYSSPTTFQYNMQPTEHYTTRKLSHNGFMHSTEEQAQHNLLSAPPSSMFSSTSIADSSLHSQASISLNSTNQTHTESNITTGTSDTTDLPIKDTSPVFHYYHDRTFFAFKPTYFLANLSLPITLWIESFVTTSFLNYTKHFLFQILNIMNTLIIDIPSHFLGYFGQPLRVYADTPLDPNLIRNHSTLTTSSPATLLVQILSSPFFYFVFFILFSIGMVLMLTHIFHQGYLSTHVYGFSFQFSFFLSLHACFVIMYRYSIHTSHLLQAYTILYPFLVATYFSTAHVLFGSFTEPYVQLRMPAYVVVLVVYAIYILSGWLLAGDLLADDIITTFVVYLLPIFTLIYSFNGFISLYQILTKLQHDFITLNFANLSIPDLIDQTEARKTRLSQYLQEWEEYDAKINADPRTDHGTGPELDLLVRPFHYHRIIERYERSQQGSSNLKRTGNKKNSGQGSHGTSAVITPSAEDVYPIPPITFLHHRIFRIIAFAIATFFVILLSSRMGISHIYFTLVFVGTISFTSMLGYSNLIIPIPRVRLPEWLGELNPEAAFGHSSDGYRFDVQDGDADFELTPLQQQYRDAIEFERQEQLKEQMDMEGNIVDQKVIKARMLSQGLGGGAPDFQPKQKSSKVTKTKGGTTYVSVQTNDSDLSDIDIELDSGPYPPPNTFPSSYSNKIVHTAQFSKLDQNDQLELENNSGLNDGVEIELHNMSHFNQYGHNNEIDQHDQTDDSSDDTGHALGSNDYMITTPGEQYANEIPVQDETGDRMSHQQYFLLLNASKNGCTSVVWVMVSFFVIVLTILLTSGQFDIFSHQFDYSKPYVYSLDSVSLATQAKSFPLSASPTPFSDTKAEFTTTADHSTTKPILVNPELEQTIDNIYFLDQINPGWANLVSGCYGQSSLTPGVEITQTIPSSSPKVEANNQSKKKSLPNAHLGLGIHKDDITTGKIVKNVELNLLKQLFFTQYEEFFQYLEDNKQIISQNYPTLKSITYPAREFNRIVDAVILRPFTPQSQQPDSNTNHQTHQQQQQHIGQNWPILFAKSPFYPSYPLPSLLTPGKTLDYQSTFDQRMVSVALPYHVLYSLYSMHYKETAHNVESEKIHQQKADLDSVLLPLRAQWHTYSSVATQDELVIRCTLDADEIDGMKVWGYLPEQRIFDIKVYLLSYLSCDQHVAQSILIHQDIELLRRCTKNTLTQSEGFDRKLDDTNNAQTDDSVDHAKIHLKQNLGLPTDEISTTTQFLLSHFHSIALFHDRSKGSHDATNIDSTHSLTNNTAMETSSDHFQQTIESTKLMPQAAPMPIHQSYTNSKSITSPLPSNLIRFIDYANHYFALSIVCFILFVFLNIYFFLISISFLIPSVKYVD